MGTRLFPTKDTEQLWSLIVSLCVFGETSLLISLNEVRNKLLLGHEQKHVPWLLFLMCAQCLEEQQDFQQQIARKIYN